MVIKGKNIKFEDKYVTIIIPTFNRKKMLIKCIDSVIASDYKKKYIIVSDDASTDGTESAIKKYINKKNFLYIKNTKESLLSITINNAIRFSKGEYIFILDDDNVLKKNCISNLVLSFNTYKKAGIVGPLALYKSHKDTIMHAGTMRSRFMRRAIFIYMNEKWAGQIKEGTEVDDFANAFMFKKEIINKIGMWDLSVPFVGEDGDFEARTTKAGYKIIINPKAITYHDIPYNPKDRYFIRINKLRLYYTMRDKIINEYRYDTLIGKITFSLSIPLYLIYYVLIIFKGNKSTKNKLELLKTFFHGIMNGFKIVLLKKSSVVWK
jgi:GT2 family glycosyltransferase